MNHIFFAELNIHGAWVIYGDLGVRQYYYTTKREAMRRYNEECARTVFTNEKHRVKPSKKDTSTVTG